MEFTSRDAKPGEIHDHAGPAEIIGEGLLRDPIVVRLSTYRGRTRLSIRAHYTDEEGVLRPSRRGIEIDRCLIDLLVQAITEFADSAGGEHLDE